MKKLLGIWVLGLMLNTNAFAASIVEKLNALNNLYKEGAITKEEFTRSKEILFESESVEEKTETKAEAKAKAKAKA